jgi:dTDP-4-dehydrorhamnose 3,5-epimerase
MEALPTRIADVFIVKPAVFGDDRGFFMETYHSGKFKELGIDLPFVQDNHSHSARGVLRGLHYQTPNPQGKLVRAATGAIFDVAVDIRRDSPTFGQWVGVELTGENKLQLWVPPGLAHGFCVTSERADVIYKCTSLYEPKNDKGIRWNDPAIGIEWPITDPLLSAKDKIAPLLHEAVPA